MNNCFHFVIQTLITKGYDIPLEWNGMKYDEFKDDIAKNPAKYITGGLMRDYIHSFTVEVIGKPKANDIIMHRTGLGILIDSYKYMTVNHLNKIKFFSVTGDFEIRRLT